MKIFTRLVVGFPVLEFEFDVLSSIGMKYMYYESRSSVDPVRKNVNL